MIKNFPSGTVSSAPHLAARMMQLAPEGAYAVMQRAMRLEREGRSIVHFEIGQPDFPTPENIVQAGVKALEGGKTRYAPTLGIPELREAVAQYTASSHGVAVHPQEVAITPSTKTALFIAFASVVEPGDEVIYPDPGFPTYGILTDFFGAVRKPVPLREERGFSFDMDAFASLLSVKTKLIILNSPSNPTGGIIPSSDLAEIIRRTKQTATWILSDDVYARMVYDGNACPLLLDVPEARDRLFVADGFSKTYAMTGWRLGWLLYPSLFEKQMDYLMTHLASCTAMFTQYAGVEALCGPQDAVHAMMLSYAKRRDAIVEGLNAIPGVTCRKPAGAFYAFPNITAYKKSSAEIAEYLLEEGGVALLPGTAFGAFGEGYLRLSYATSDEHIHEGLARIKKSLAEL